MFRLEIRENGFVKTVSVKAGTPLSLVLEESSVPHYCGKNGLCKKCTVTVNGKKELSCRYTVKEDAIVEIEAEESILSPTGAEESLQTDEKMCLCFDIGTTTLVLALVSQLKKEIIFSVSRNNPQRIHGADLMSRIDYVRKNGVSLLRRELLISLREMREEIFSRFGIEEIETLFVSGNTAMLHIFLGEDCSSMGIAPYTPVFLEGKTLSASAAGTEKIRTVTVLPSISAFAGADIVAGLNLIAKPGEEVLSVLMDLGTNAETALISGSRILCTSAAAGPCFECANISKGMSAVNGAVSKVSPEGKLTVIGEGEAKGICATGLIDLIAFLRKKEIIDSTGLLLCSGDYHLTENVSLTQEDVRQFQIAKAAVSAALHCLFKKADADFGKADKLYISGGFSAALEEESLIESGIVPPEFRGKIVPLGNSSLLGTVKFAAEGNDLSFITGKAEYIDLGGDRDFERNFIDNINFR